MNPDRHFFRAVSRIHRRQFAKKLLWGLLKLGVLAGAFTLINTCQSANSNSTGATKTEVQQ